jgi:hypothetical protein
MTAPRLLPWLALLFVCAIGNHPVRAEDEAVVAWVTIEDARAAMIAAGLPEPTDRTADPDFPSLGSGAGDKVGVQITLYGCRPDGRCLGAQLFATIRATEARFADIIVGSVEQSVAGFDAQRLDVPTADGTDYVVMIKGYIMFDYGVSPRLLPEMTASLLGIVDQTKVFMLEDDPSHAELWRGED